MSVCPLLVLFLAVTLLEPINSHSLRYHRRRNNWWWETDIGPQAPERLEERSGRRSNKCRGCGDFFQGDDLKLCVDVHCKTEATRPSVRNEWRCNKCGQYQESAEWEKDCRKLFCPIPITASTTAAPDAGGPGGSIAGFGVLNLTTDILCAYCREIQSNRCITLYCNT